MPADVRPTPLGESGRIGPDAPAWLAHEPQQLALREGAPAANAATQRLCYPFASPEPASPAAAPSSASEVGGTTKSLSRSVSAWCAGRPQ
jgi:hypothetical protein